MNNFIWLLITIVCGLILDFWFPIAWYVSIHTLPGILWIMLNAMFGWNLAGTLKMIYIKMN